MVLVEFNSDYQKDVSQHIDLIREIINNMDSDFIPISHYEVTAAITKLNKNCLRSHAMSCRCCDRMSLLMARRSSTIG
jgi:hypothetical protein